MGYPWHASKPRPAVDLRTVLSANSKPTLRYFVPANPRNTLGSRLRRVYWRMTFCGRRVVNYKNLYTDKEVLRGVMVYTTSRPISPCVQHMLHKKGFRVEDARCDWDTCFTCTDGTTQLRFKQTQW